MWTAIILMEQCFIILLQEWQQIRLNIVLDVNGIVQHSLHKYQRQVSVVTYNAIQHDARCLVCVSWTNLLGRCVCNPAANKQFSFVCIDSPRVIFSLICAMDAIQFSTATITICQSWKVFCFVSCGCRDIFWTLEHRYIMPNITFFKMIIQSLERPQSDVLSNGSNCTKTGAHIYLHGIAHSFTTLNLTTAWVTL